MCVFLGAFCGYQLIKSQSGTPENTEKNAHSRNRAAPGAAVGAENNSDVSDLAAVLELYTTLPDQVKASILALVKAATEGGCDK